MSVILFSLINKSDFQLSLFRWGSQQCLLRKVRFVCACACMRQTSRSGSRLPLSPSNSQNFTVCVHVGVWVHVSGNGWGVLCRYAHYLLGFIPGFPRLLSWRCCKAITAAIFIPIYTYGVLLFHKLTRIRRATRWHCQSVRRTNKLVIDHVSLLWVSQMYVLIQTKQSHKRRTITADHNSSSFLLLSVSFISKNLSLSHLPSVTSPTLFPFLPVLYLWIPLAWHGSWWRSF